MLLQTQMYCGVVVRFVTCVCLVGFAAAKCVPEKCGDFNVSYPFWINNSDCGYPGFNITCMKDADTGKMVPFLPVYNNTRKYDYINTRNYINTRKYDYNNTLAYYEIREINYSGYIVISSRNLKAFTCMEWGEADTFILFQLPMPGPFTISRSNKFVVVGCNSSGRFSYGEHGPQAICLSSCDSQSVPPYCSRGCCEMTLPDNRQWFDFSGGGVFTLDGHKKCGFSTIMDPNTLSVRDNKTNHFMGDRKVEYGLRLNWGIGHHNCSVAKEAVNYSCSINAQCNDSLSEVGYVCKCFPGYVGSGYSIGTGCTDIDECNNRTLNNCVERSKGGECQNLKGSYNCTCAKDYSGDGFQNGSRCESERSNKTAMFAAIGSISSFVGVSLGALGLVFLLKKRYEKQARDEYFRCNGGFLLERILTEKGNQTEGKIFKIFSENELKRASQDYSDDMKLGTGGSSTVYKGILPNGTAVAIKKFKEFPVGVESEEAMKQFINEIVILSGLNHKNVVKLVGCCLQTQSPLLVYEFVDGGTISHQLHSGHLNWQSRLQIARGSADALAYLHSELDRPIIHRDVKSTNILLDNTVTPKVADFGISRLLCGNDTHLTTNIMGTCGYMDPEYYETGTLTEKSDVYSFAVFLAELLTGRDPLSPGRPPHEIILSKFFLSKYKDDCLTDILDSNVKNEENQYQMIAVASLARECLCHEGKGRPTMREVKIKLEEIGGSTRLATSTSCLNVRSDHISSETKVESTSSLFQLTEMSRMQGR
ncbi:wall-associated receptor kinase 2 [Cryptomeria japonica]|uniref:wall-associated receptor kinase 2 n=1 Tax=Cryptomeria japonica TaxID=3369 RepID=UPI0027DA8784|nr:wall-associated receptor kinase 2 [Cryptomeria japonica]